MGRVFRPKVGDVVQILHLCRFQGRLVSHVNPFTIDNVVKLNDGGYRSEASRCDGSRIHLIYDAQGVEVGR